MHIISYELPIQCCVLMCRFLYSKAKTLLPQTNYSHTFTPLYYFKTQGLKKSLKKGEKRENGKGLFHFAGSIKAFLKYKLNSIENVKSLLSPKKLSYSQHFTKKKSSGKYIFTLKKECSVPGKQRISIISPFEYFLILMNFLKRLTEVSFLQPKASESEISIFSSDSYTIYRTKEQITM